MAAKKKIRKTGETAQFTKTAKLSETTETTEPGEINPNLTARVALPYLRLLVPAVRYRGIESLLDNTLYRRLITLAGQGLVVSGLAVYGAALLWFLGRRLGLNWFGEAAIVGLILVFGGFVVFSFAAYTLRLALGAQQSPITSDDIESEQRDELRRIQTEQREQDQFLSNLLRTFVLQSLQLQGVRLFEDCTFTFQPGVNVLLGRNGYGKTLLLRTLAGVVQNDKYYSALLFDPKAAIMAGEGTLITLTALCDYTTERELLRTVRDSLTFRERMGKIPLLAIPDSRFVNRLATIAPSPTGHEPLWQSGARQFMTQETYDDVVRELLAQLGIVYWSSNRYLKKGFDRPLFRLLESVIRSLSGDEAFCFHTIRQVGRTGFEILVLTSASNDEPLPIQSASQGTLSVIAIFGLIYSFLESLNQGMSRDAVEFRPGIVIIDEIDAHLHPSWQQKIIGLLQDKFPNVQFIVSAHSPLIVAGCAWGEVSVLRKNPETGKYYVEEVKGDFVGVQAEEIYRRAFEIDDIDENYLHLATAYTGGRAEELLSQIEQLEKQTGRSPQSEREMERLLRQYNLIMRAGEVREDRLASAAQHEDLRSSADQSGITGSLGVGR